MNKKTAKMHGAGRKRGRKAKTGQWIFFSILTLLNLIVSIAIRVSDRKNVVSAIKEDDRLSLLYTGEKTTKTL